MTEILHSPLPTSTITTQHHNVSSPQNTFLNYYSPFARNPLAFEVLEAIFKCRRTTTGMEIGSPTNVRHVAHVTYDRFNGFLGLPVEFEPEVPRRPPSASTTVFGVSTESMHLSFDSRGNCVPTILLMMQRRLYSQGGLQSEGIFRINPDNGQEEYVRQQLNNGLIPDDIDVHCLAGLIKAWFRELPRGILDPLPPERVMEAQSEDDCADLGQMLPPTEAALLDWAINLMADVVQMENANKMNARNISMVFAPNMTQMSDPLTALMYAVQVMNFLKTLVSKTLRERQDFILQGGPVLQLEPPPDADGHEKPMNLEADEESREEEVDGDKEHESNHTISSPSWEMPETSDETQIFLSCIKSILLDGNGHGAAYCSPADIPKSAQNDDPEIGTKTYLGSEKTRSRLRIIKTGQPGSAEQGSAKQQTPRVNETAGLSKEMSIISNGKMLLERSEAWT